MMANSALLKLLLLTVTFVLLNHSYILLQPKGVSAELVFSPLWDVNNSALCDIYPVDETGQSFALHGHPSDFCSLQITAINNSATLIQITQQDCILYIERQTSDCTDKILTIDGQNESCGTVVLDKMIQLHFQGNVSVLTYDIQTDYEHDQLVCGVDIDPQDTDISDISQIMPRCNVKEYISVYTCTLSKKGRCSLELPQTTNCNVTLAYREISLRCVDLLQNQRSLLYYPSNMVELHLKDSNIVDIDVNAFKGLSNLQSLRLHFNCLEELPLGVFEGLNALAFLNLRENQLIKLESGLFHGLVNLNTILLQWNLLTTLPSDIFQNLVNLVNLKLYNNRLLNLDGGVFKDLQNMTNIDLSHNSLSALVVDLFQGLFNLEILLLQNNVISILDSNIFQDLERLNILSLAYNKLTHLDDRLFEKTTALTFLDISDNLLHKIPKINHLSTLNYLNLKGNWLREVSKYELSGLQKPVDLFVGQPEICICYAPTGVNCSTSIPQSPYLTCERLLSDRVLVVIMWLIGLSAIAGNVFVLWWRSTHVAKYNVQRQLILNLATSDLLMGVYMVIIASADVHFGDNFPVNSESWRTGVTCRIAGVLSILSSEASVFFVTLISIDRLISIKYPYTAYKFGKRSIVEAAFFVWTFAGALGIIPAILSGRNPDFYDNSHVCIGIPLTLVTSYSTHSFEKAIDVGRFFSLDTDVFTTRLIGSEPGLFYATALFIGLNSLCYLIVLGCYIELLRVVYKAIKREEINEEMKDQISLTAKVTAIVATDFLCWCPIIVLGILVQTEVITLPPSVFAWAVTFILPLNSAINPYLYTITDLINSRRNKPTDQIAVTMGTETPEQTTTAQLSPVLVLNASYVPEQEEVILHVSKTYGSSGDGNVQT